MFKNENKVSCQFKLIWPAPFNSHGSFLTLHLKLYSFNEQAYKKLMVMSSFMFGTMDKPI
ncbi:hypothetical protein CN946_20905 [Bacillus sp. AFS053548]|nr:hypothetical protein CN946_20905 [Bacillus sp. AFS053548]